MPVERFYGLFFWSNLEGCWAVLCTGSDRAKLESLGERLAIFADLELRIKAVPSDSDDDVETVCKSLKLPWSVDFIRPEACDQ